MDELNIEDEYLARTHKFPDFSIIRFVVCRIKEIVRLESTEDGEEGRKGFQIFCTRNSTGLFG